MTKQCSSCGGFCGKVCKRTIQDIAMIARNCIDQSIELKSSKRKWVGLTDAEVEQFHHWKNSTWSTNELVRHVEAKLKEKNGL